MGTIDVVTGPQGLLSRTAAAEDAATIRVRGDLDDGVLQEVAHAIAEAVSSGRADVVLDLGDVAFLDAEGLEFIVRARRRVARGGGTLTVSRPTPGVRRLLAVCGIVDLDLSSRPPAPARAPGRASLAFAGAAESRMYGT